MAENVVTPPDEWTPDQVLDPESLVDLYVFDRDHLTHAQPGSTVNPPKPPEPTATIGKITITGPGLSGDAAAWTTGDEHELTAAIDGDASDTVYVWSVTSGDAIGFVGVNAGKTVHVSCEKAGSATLRCLATATATDSPQEKTLSIVVTDPTKQTKNTKNTKK